MKFGAAFRSAAALTVLYASGAASATETTAWVTVRDVAIERITLSNGQIFSVPSSFPSAVTKVGSLIRVTFEEYGENDDEKKVTRIVLLREDRAGHARLPASTSPVTIRTTSKTVTFTRPFVIDGLDEVQPAGSYEVETDEELLESLSFPAYRRLLTLIRLPPRPTHPGLTRSVSIDPQELEAALRRDAERDNEY